MDDRRVIPLPPQGPRPSPAGQVLERLAWLALPLAMLTGIAAGLALVSLVHVLH